jgi:hypothetical protein
VRAGPIRLPPAPLARAGAPVGARPVRLAHLRQRAPAGAWASWDKGRTAARGALRAGPDTAVVAVTTAKRLGSADSMVAAVARCKPPLVRVPAALAATARCVSSGGRAARTPPLTLETCNDVD